MGIFCVRPLGSYTIYIAMYIGNITCQQRKNMTFLKGKDKAAAASAGSAAAAAAGVTTAASVDKVNLGFAAELRPE